MFSIYNYMGINVSLRTIIILVGLGVLLLVGSKGTDWKIAANEDKVEECIELCSCVGSYEQPDRDPKNMELACTAYCRDEPFRYNGDIDALVDEFETKCRVYSNPVTTKDATESTPETKPVPEVSGERISEEEIETHCTLACAPYGKLHHTGVNEDPKFHFYWCMCNQDTCEGWNVLYYDLVTREYVGECDGF